MSKKHHGGPGPVPAGNRPQGGPEKAAVEDGDEATPDAHETGTGFSDQDAAGRQGNFTGAGEHPIKQPGPRNDGGQKH